MKKFFMGLCLITIVYTIKAQIEVQLSARDWYYWGQKFFAQKKYDDAINAYKHALELEPKNISYNYSLAHCYISIGMMQEAIKHHMAILQKYPNDIASLYNIGYCFRMCEKYDQAIAIFNQVLARDPEYFEANIALPLSYLAKGDFINGWHYYTWRLKKERRNGEKLRSYLATNNLVNKKILLLHEGGLGDTFQFIRYAKILHDLGAEIIVCVPDSLIPLLSLCPYIDKFIPLGSRPEIHDDMITIMSLPAIFCDTNEQHMSCMVPYLYADQQHVDYWKHQIACDKNFKIGLCWQSTVTADESRIAIAHRSIPLILLSKLAQIPGISFYALQKDWSALEQIAQIPENFKIHSFGNNFDYEHGAFMDTAALMQNLDLVITVDTSIAHLAGGLGISVWVMLPYATDWRWIVNRTDSPWYPTMHIFKQQKPFDWQGVVEKIYEALNNKISSKQEKRL